MAAFIGWVDANVGATPIKRGQASKVAGGTYRRFSQSWAKATTDGNGTIYGLVELPSDAVVDAANICNDALAGCTSVDLGIYKLDTCLPGSAAAVAAGASVAGTPISTPVDAGAIFMTAKDISAGITLATGYDAYADNVTAQTVTTLGATARGKLAVGLKVWELLGFTDPKWKEDSYLLGMRLNTAGSAAGNIAIRGGFIQG